MESRRFDALDAVMVLASLVGFIFSVIYMTILFLDAQAQASES